jgi:hypothetical protein
MRSTLKPERRSTDFKLSLGRKKTDLTSKRIVEKTDKRGNNEAEFLIYALDNSEMLRELCSHEIVFLVLSSSTYQNLYKKI